MRKHVSAAAMVAACFAVAAGCGSDDDSDTTAATGSASTPAATQPAATETTTAPAADAKPANVAVLLPAITTFTDANVKGIKAAVTPGGGSVKLFNANFDPQKTASQCQDAVSSGRYNAIVLAVFSPPLGVPCAQIAKAAGIPVIALGTPVGKDYDSLEPQVPGIVGGVYFTPSGKTMTQVELTKAACEGIDPCKVIGEVATPNDPLTNQPIDGLKELPNVEVVAKLATNYDPGLLAQKLPDILAANPDANVFASAADSQALAALPAIKKAGLEGKIKILGSGGSVEGAEAIADGTMFGTVGGWPEQDGVTVGEMAVKAVNGEAIDPAGLDTNDTDTPLIILKDNVGEFKAEWGNG